jgi:methylated-DNA-[protein]-cysteine S-methyltransferase
VLRVIQIATLETPIGPLFLAAHGDRVCLLYFGAKEKAARADLDRWYPGAKIEPHPDPAGAAAKLHRYFEGDLSAVDDVEVEMNGTPFQREVWAALRRVKAGETTSYAEIARRIGRAAAVRAVGAANGANPVSIIVPCHRIVGTNGTLTGYGGGLDRKEWLLRHEGSLPTEARRAKVALLF